MIKDVFLKRGKTKKKKKNYLRQKDLFFLLQGKFLRRRKKGPEKKSEFGIEKSFSLVMNRCELVFRQQYRRENNTTARRKPQNTARQNDRLRRHSDAKHSEKYTKIKKLGYYCFSRRLVLPRPPPLPSSSHPPHPQASCCRMSNDSFAVQPTGCGICDTEEEEEEEEENWAGLGDGSRQTRRQIFLREFCLGCRERAHASVLRSLHPLLVLFVFSGWRR